MAADHEWEPVIGLEVHAQLQTKTKLFCACRTSFGDPPNTHTCPVCLGLPGSLPVLNGAAVKLAVRAALALGCSIAERSIFARKNYFYPDLPKGYQISQYDRPFALEGHLDIAAGDSGAASADVSTRRVSITRVHMEEDAGKNVHGSGERSIVDLNRAGTPLIEIVGAPDLRSAAEAGDYLRRLRNLLVFLGVCDGNLEQGSFRCDANVSVRRAGDPLGVRAELKNINSFRFVEDAIGVEVRRQIGVLEAGGRVRQETRGYSADRRDTYPLRSKENEAGYRYFPEPDLPPLDLPPALQDEIRAAMPETPAAKRDRYVAGLGLTPYAAGVLTSHPGVATFFEEACGLLAKPDPLRVANFIQSEVLRGAETSGLEARFPVTPAQVAEICALVAEGIISGKQAKELYQAVEGSARSPREVAAERGMSVLSDAGALTSLVEALVAQNPKQVAGYRSGKTNLLGFFVGQVMKETKGRANPALVNDLLKRTLDGEPLAADPSARVSETLAPSNGAVTASAPAMQPAVAVVPAPPIAVVAVVATPAPTPPSPPSKGTTPPPSSHPAGPTSQGPMEIPLTLTYDDFARLDLRVGTVVSATRVPRKDKLLDLRVDVGDAGGPRRIVAGIAQTFTPESLLGKQIVVICNLEPRVFSKNLVSEGMLLAAGPSDGLSLIAPFPAAPSGTRVK